MLSSLGDVWSGGPLEAADEMGAHSFYRLHCGAADGRKEAAFVIIFCVIYYLMRREMEETGAKRMRTSAFRSRK